MKFDIGFILLYLYIKVNYLLTLEVFSSIIFRSFNLYSDPFVYIYIYI